MSLSSSDKRRGEVAQVGALGVGVGVDGERGGQIDLGALLGIGCGGGELAGRPRAGDLGVEELQLLRVYARGLEAAHNGFALGGIERAVGERGGDHGADEEQGVSLAGVAAGSGAGVTDGTAALAVLAPTG